MEELENQQAMIRYLLGEMSGKEKDEFEDRYWADDQFFDDLQTVEEDLIGRYVRGALPESEQAQFEQVYLSSPDRRAEVEFARTMFDLTSDSMKFYSRLVAPPPPPSSWWSLLAFVRNRHKLVVWSLAATSLLMIAAACWFAIESLRLHYNIRELEQQKEAAEHQPAKQAPANNRQDDGASESGSETKRADLPDNHNEAAQANRAAPVVGTVTRILVPLRRDLTAKQVLEVPADIKELNLQINLGSSDYERYQVTLMGDSTLLLRLEDVKPLPRAGGSIIVSVPAQFLNKTNYEIILSGVNDHAPPEEIGLYAFTLVKQ